MNARAMYEKWMQFDQLDEELREQLETTTDEAILEDMFYKNLEFGTGGMRGLIGAGTNRMNKYTIRKATAGLTRYIARNGDEAKARGVVIAYDSRHYSVEFAKEAAKTLGYEGIHVYLFDGVRTTPELSFAVRFLHAYAGIVITASHNPAAYNGFKVYSSDGAQFASRDADIITSYVDAVDNALTIPVAEEAQLQADGLLTMIGATVDNAYHERLQQLIVNQENIHEVADDFRMVYTPLHGTGNVPVMRALQEAGFANVDIVEEQAQPDGNFPTVAFPNPEEPAAFSLAMEYGERLDSDLLLATDPDADRVGIAVKNGTEYELLTGNQIGALLMHYLITEKQAQGTLPQNGAVLKTIVTSELGRDIAEAHGLTSIDTLTGFKYISEKIKQFETTGEHEFLLGYEESYGYLIGDFVRDKDAVQACLLIAEVAASYHKKGMTLVDALEEIFSTYGYYKEGLTSLTLEGRAGVEKIHAILETFRAEPPEAFAGKRVLIREDYEEKTRTYVEDGRIEKITLPTSNVLKYKLENGAWICVRPSGTEPKIKFYLGVKEASLKESEAVLEALQEDVMKRVVD